jgi:hypothetical protein
LRCLAATIFPSAAQGNPRSFLEKFAMAGRHLQHARRVRYPEQQARWRITNHAS